MIAKRAPILFAWLISLTLSACHNQANHAERAKPQIAITADSVFIRRSPAADIRIAANTQEGQPGNQVELRIDDLLLPLQPRQQSDLANAFNQWRQLRQHLIDSGKLTAQRRSTHVQAPPELASAQARLLQDIPELAPYRQSFTNLQATWH